jgi:DNA primase
VFDAAGRLINIKGRTRYENYKDLRLPKYINYYPVGDMDYFQGFREAEPYIRETGEAIICESVKSVMKCWAWGIKNVISAESHNITDKQLRLLVKLGADLVIAFDNDVIKTYYTDKGRALREQFSKLAKFTGVYVIMNGDGLGEKDAPMDKGKEVFLELYGKKRRWR